MRDPVLNGGGAFEALVRQSWDRFTFGGQPARQQTLIYINLREIRDLPLGTPAPLPYKDYSLVPEGRGQAPVLRLTARGTFSVRVVDPIRFFMTDLPAGASCDTLGDPGVSSQLRQEFLTAFQAALQSLSRSVEISSITAHSLELVTALRAAGGTGMVGLAMGIGAVSNTVQGLAQPTEAAEAPTRAVAVPVATLAQLKAMVDQGLISGSSPR